jgi:hypothetical protein
LIEASNVIIKRDGIIEQRRGFSLYGSELPDNNTTVKQLTTYRNRILRHFSTTLQFDSDSVGNFQSFDGNFTETIAGLRMKFIESNGNLYFTTDEGIKKISARNADDFTTNPDFVVSAGAIKAVDLTGKTIYMPNLQGGWFPQDSAVAYRVLWAYNDLNANLIQGAPSQRLVVSNPMINFLIRDYTRILSNLDTFDNTGTTARINDRNYIQTLGLTLNATANELYTNLLQLTTKLDNDILYANQAPSTPSAPLQIVSAAVESGLGTVSVTGPASGYLSPGSKIYLEGFPLATRQEIQTVKFAGITSPTSGKFRLKYNLAETADIYFDDSLNVLNEKITFSVTPTGGTFTLAYSGTATTALAFNATNAAIAAALNTAGLTGVTVTGGINSTTGLTLIRTAGIPSLVTATSSLTPATVITTVLSAGIQQKLRAVAGLENVSVSGAVDLITGLTLTFPAIDGDLSQVIEGSGNTLSPASTITTATTSNGIKTASGDINKGQIVVTAQEIQKLTLAPAAASGSFTISFNDYTSTAINYNSSSASVETIIKQVKGLENTSITTIGGGVNISEISIIFGTNSSKGSVISITNSTPSLPTISVNSTITFNTTAVGAVTLTSPKITSNEYRSLTQPTSPSIPATNDQLVNMQVYLEDILTRLSAENDRVISSDQKVTFSATPVGGYFVLKYGKFNSYNLNWDDPLTTNEKITFNITPTGGTYVLKYGLNTSVPIASNATLLTIQNAIRAIPGLNDVVVTSGTRTTTSNGGIDETDYDVGLTIADPTNGGITTEIIVETNNLTPSTTISTSLYSGIQNKLRASLTGVDNIVVTGSVDSVTGLTLSSVDGLPSSFTIDSSGLDSIGTVITAAVSTSNILSFDDIAITTTATTELTITIPQGINPNYFFQIYRTSVAQATGVATFDDLVPNEEYQLVYEAYPTVDELNVTRSITVEDVTPDAFRGANLYTNSATGEGILQANETPPFAKDINRYRNSIFYANTRTRQQLLISLLGVTNMVNSFDINNPPKLTISDGIKSNTYQFVTGQTEVTDVSVTTIVVNSKYFLISSTTTDYYVWFSVDGNGIDPKDANPLTLSTRTGIRVSISSTEDTDTDKVAQKIKNVLSSYLSDFIPTVDGSIVTIQNYSFGVATDSDPGDTGFSINKVQDGRSEDESTLSVLLSTVVSPARAVDETAKSLVRIINKNVNENVYAYYVSSAYDVPGKIYLQARTLEQSEPFYILGNSSTIGQSFNPDISPDNTITNVIIGVDPLMSTIFTSLPHGMLTGDKVMITGTNTESNIDGLYPITRRDSTSFSIVKADIHAGTTGQLIKASSAVYSENEQRANRIYYSKFQQPEAVPSVNYFDVGAQDKAILRILPLRSSLFVFKEDGLYRISGESAPFQLELFDISFNVLAPDSVVVCNNVIYAWTTQGVQSLTEGGASIISRSIDNIILKTQSSNFTSFKTATWGVGYESDNSYLVYTVSQQEDEVATIAYRFSTLTNTWTTYKLSHVAGIVNSANDKLYLAASDVAFIEQERKTFSRLDYADREVDSFVSSNKVSKNSMKLPSITGLSVGDVITQDQTITTTNFNILLEKLDLDSGVADNDYLSTLKLIQGISPRDQLVKLAIKLDSDTAVIPETGMIYGVNYTQFQSNIESKNGTIIEASAATSTIITTPTPHGLLDGRVITINSANTIPVIDGIYPITLINSTSFSIPAKVILAGTSANWNTVDSNFDDLKICHNFIVSILNVDIGTSFNNYRPITNNTLMESIITSINVITKKLTLNLDLDYLIGDVRIYKAFESSFAYSPITFGDPLMLKHVREATMMFETRTLTNGIISFRTDLLPEMIDVPFSLDGNGIFGHVDGFGDGFFGGLSSSAPFRTYIPRQCQRCRYIIIRFSHNVAREDYRVNGCTLTGEIGQSSRAYR